MARRRDQWQALVTACHAGAALSLRQLATGHRARGSPRVQSKGPHHEINKSSCPRPSRQTAEPGAKALILDLLHTC